VATSLETRIGACLLAVQVGPKQMQICCPVALVSVFQSVISLNKDVLSVITQYMHDPGALALSPSVSLRARFVSYAHLVPEEKVEERTQTVRRCCLCKTWLHCIGACRRDVICSCFALKLKCRTCTEDLSSVKQRWLTDFNNLEFEGPPFAAAPLVLDRYGRQTVKQEEEQEEPYVITHHAGWCICLGCWRLRVPHSAEIKLKPVFQNTYYDDLLADPRLKAKGKLMFWRILSPVQCPILRLSKTHGYCHSDWKPDVGADKIRF